jgi:hypothetical protein
MRGGTRISRLAGAAAVSAFVAFVLALALLQLRGWNGLVNADGVSYLDLAVQCAHGDLSAVANGYWSPLYPTLLGAALALTRVPTVYLGNAAITPELRVVFAVNALVLLFTTGLFARLLPVSHRKLKPSSLFKMRRRLIHGQSRARVLAKRWYVRWRSRNLER